MATANYITNLARELEDDGTERNDAYDLVLKHYGGDIYTERKKRGTWGNFLQYATDLFRKRGSDEDIAVDNAINLTRPTILAKVAFMGLPPTIRVPEPPMEDAAAASKFADDLEKCLLGHWKFSNMPRRCYDMAWYQGAFGAAIMGVWPDIRAKRPRIFTRSPQNFYPVCYDEDGMEIKECLWIEKGMRGRDVAARWDVPKLADRNEIDVIQYVSESEMCVVADNEMLVRVDNPMGVVPVVVIGNIGVPGTPFGDTDVGAALTIESEINYRVALADEMAAKMLNPTVAVTNPQDVPDDFEIGQGGRITMGERGKVDLLSPPPIPPSYWESIQLLQGWWDQIADNPAALRSEGFGSILTGKGFNALLSPLAARLQIRRNLIDPAIEQVNRYLLTMWDVFPKFDRKTRFSAGRGKDFFTVEFSPKDFKVDGKLWTENEVFLSSNSFIDRQGEVVELMQLYQNELISWDTVMEYNPYIRNKARERVRIEQDRQWKAEGMAMAQQMATSAATANPDLGAQERTAYGLERGFMGEMPTPPGAEAQMQAGAPAPEGQEVPDVIDVIVQALSEIPKLKGQVWVGGDVLLSPESVTPDGDWTVTVWLENPVDKATISNFLRKELPELHGRIEYHSGEPSGEEPAIPVGEQVPEEMPPGMMEAPMEEMPPGMMEGMPLA
ncbi:MAG: hypothetical protein PHU54_06155 [Candidatus Omnitrophica bacterium]|nr:hypothetical protein [Candidatus Omnitrophota bacterium]